MFEPAADSFVMRVKGSSDVRKVAAALYHNLNQYSTVTLRTLGAGPTQQAMKAVAIAGSRLQPEGFDLLCSPHLHDVPSDNGETQLTALSIVCFKIQHGKC